MNRWWLVPYAYQSTNSLEATGCGPVSFFKRPIAWTLQRFGIAIRVHEILRSDTADIFHDHPWPYITVLLRGRYVEETPIYDKSDLYWGSNKCDYHAGHILFRKAQSWHRLEILPEETCFTLFITGKKKQGWGFLTTPRFKTYYRDFLKGKVRPNE